MALFCWTGPMGLTSGTCIAVLPSRRHSCAECFRFRFILEAGKNPRHEKNIQNTTFTTPIFPEVLRDRGDSWRFRWIPWRFSGLLGKRLFSLLLKRKFSPGELTAPEKSLLEAVCVVGGNSGSKILFTTQRSSKLAWKEPSAKKIRQLQYITEN